MILFSFLTIQSFAQWTIPNLDALNNQTINCSTYESTDSNFKIDYPSDWVIAENSSNNIEFRPQITSESEGAACKNECYSFTVKIYNNAIHCR